MHRNSDSTEAETAHPNRFSGALVSRDETLGWEELRDPTLLLGASPRLHSRTNAAYALLIPRCIQLRAQRETARTAVTESADRRHSHRPPNMIRQTLTALLVLAAPAIAQAESSAKKNPVDKTVVELAVQNGKFNTLVAAVKAAGLAETLSGKGPFTIFAPTDEAFAKLPKETLESLLKPENKQKLVSILTYHVAAAKMPASDVVKATSITTVNGQSLTVVTKDGKVTVDGASVVATDVMGTNGVIHVIDTVVLPKPNLVETAANAKSFTTLLAAAQAAGLAETLATGGTFTVFAPTDEAFAKLGKETIESLLKPENKEKLASILKHHVVAGSVMAAQAVELTEAKTIGETKLSLSYDKKTKVLTVGGAKVVSADVVAGNGVIHVVDSVILPSKN